MKNTNSIYLFNSRAKILFDQFKENIMQTIFNSGMISELDSVTLYNYKVCEFAEKLLTLQDDWNRSDKSHLDDNQIWITNEQFEYYNQVIDAKIFTTNDILKTL